MKKFTKSGLIAMFALAVAPVFAAPANELNPEYVVLLKNGSPVFKTAFTANNNVATFENLQITGYLADVKDGVLTPGEAKTGVQVKIVRIHTGGYDVTTVESVLQGMETKALPGGNVQVPVMSKGEVNQHVMQIGQFND
jgi:hypothetical protein